MDKQIKRLLDLLYDELFEAENLGTAQGIMLAIRELIKDEPMEINVSASAVPQTGESVNAKIQQTSPAVWFVDNSNKQSNGSQQSRQITNEQERV